MMLRLFPRCVAGLTLSLGLVAVYAADTPNLANPGPHSPKEELATFRLSPGFRAELVACEPDVVDPVSMCFDENGRIVVCEMRGYPNAGVGTGTVTSGRIKILEDRDGDGFYETSTLFADTLRLPMGVMPWRGGYLVAQAPDILFLEDTDGDGKADKRQVLYTGFALGNIQQMINGLQFGLDNWVHGNAGLTGGSITCPAKPEAAAIELRGRGVRFHPDVPGSLEPTSSGGQYGLAPDDYQRYFVNTNSQHLRHVVLPDHYLRRNPALPVAAVTLDIPEHGASCKVFRISPFEAWRVERTTRRKGDKELAKRMAATELVPGGYVTSGCSPLVYCADAFPPSHRGSVFVCDPANNLVLRDTLHPRGATFTARRADAEREFFASTDNWCRPVQVTLGPDGAIYLLDFYREVIETPLSLPDDIKARVNLQSRGRGRIWRIRAEDAPRGEKPAQGKASVAELVKRLAEPNLWWRLTAQRLLFQRQDKSAVAPLIALAKSCEFAPGRAHALWALRGLGALDDSLIVAALTDAEPGVREQGLRLADARLTASEIVRAAAVKLVNDADARVRFQLAFTLGESDAPEAVAALATLARRSDNDTWTQTALLSSLGRSAPALLETLAADPQFTRAASAGSLGLLTRVASLVAARGGDAELARALTLLKSDGNAAAWQLAVLDGLGQGMRSTGKSLAKLWDSPPDNLKEAVAAARSLFVQAARRSGDDKLSPAERSAALRLLASGPFAIAEEGARGLLTPQTPTEVQVAAARTLAAHDSPRAAELLLAGWPAYGPAMRREVLEALFARPDRVNVLLDAVEQKKVLAVQMEPTRLDLLRKHPNAAIRARAGKLLVGQAAPERQKVIDSYRSALEMKSDVARGKAAFQRVCSTCHRLENVGFEVGADLMAALGNKTPELLLIDILDPNKEVDPRYLNYVVETKQGQSISGLIAAESAASLTLRRGEKAEDTVLRGQIEAIATTNKSLMPEGLEQQLTKQDFADLVAYLRTVVTKK